VEDGGLGSFVLGSTLRIHGTRRELRLGFGFFLIFIFAHLVYGLGGRVFAFINGSLALFFIVLFFSDTHISYIVIPQFVYRVSFYIRKIELSSLIHDYKLIT